MTGSGKFATPCARIQATNFSTSLRAPGETAGYGGCGFRRRRRCPDARNPGCRRAPASRYNDGKKTGDSHEGKPGRPEPAHDQPPTADAAPDAPPPEGPCVAKWAPFWPGSNFWHAVWAAWNAGELGERSLPRARLYGDADPTTAAGMEDRVGEVGYAVGPHALGELEGLRLGLGDLGGARAVPDARGWRKSLAASLACWNAGESGPRSLLGPPWKVEAALSVRVREIGNAMCPHAFGIGERAAVACIARALCRPRSRGGAELGDAGRGGAATAAGRQQCTRDYNTEQECPLWQTAAFFRRRATWCHSIADDVPTVVTASTLVIGLVLLAAR